MDISPESLKKFRKIAKEEYANKGNRPARRWGTRIERASRAARPDRRRRFGAARVARLCRSWGGVFSSLPGLRGRVAVRYQRSTVSSIYGAVLRIAPDRSYAYGLELSEGEALAHAKRLLMLFELIHRPLQS